MNEKSYIYKLTKTIDRWGYSLSTFCSLKNKKNNDKRLKLNEQWKFGFHTVYK